MRFGLVFLAIIFSILSGYSEIVERGVVKEYRGVDAKKVLPGVELMVKGAQSTVSDVDGVFELWFTTLKPGEKIYYTDIYKEGFVIFNKDALEAWRISNNGRPFTIVMCKESDFRALKKKYYDIIERSYYDEYLKQKKIAEEMLGMSIQLTQKIQELEREYQVKMSNINTYVELFSRIDLNEMDSIEARSLEFMEQGKIDEAIRLYEELQLTREMDAQMSKWDMAEEMRRAANGMESEAQADLIMLVGKMQKQISLYQMGGGDYDIKRLDLTDNLIALLYRLLPITGNQYKETLGQLIIDQTASKHPKTHFEDFKKAAYLPSVIGLRKLADAYKIMDPSEEHADSMRTFYMRALRLIDNPDDSISRVIEENLTEIPQGYFKNDDGWMYPYRIIDNEAELMSQGPYYSAHIEGEVELPDVIVTDKGEFPVTAIGKFAFGNNSLLTKVTLPRYCHRIGENAFKLCPMLEEITVNAELDSLMTEDYSQSIPLNVSLRFPEVPQNIDWIVKRATSVLNDSTLDVSPLILAMAQYYHKNGDTDSSLNCYEYIVDKCIGDGNIEDAQRYALMAKDTDKNKYHLLLSKCLKYSGDFPGAIKEAKKGLNDNEPRSYNNIAYLYIDDKNPAKDFDEAIKNVDHALKIATTPSEKANFYDSKGEIYLLMSDEQKAKEYYMLALDNDSLYWQNAISVLHQHFNPDINVTKEEPITEEQISQRRKRNAAIALMAMDFIRPRIAGINGADIDSIKDYAVSLIVSSDMTDPKLFNTNAEQVFAAALMGAGQYLFSLAEKDSVRFDNEWIGLIDADEQHGLDARIATVVRNMMVLHQFTKMLPCNYLSDRDVKNGRIYEEAFRRYAATLKNDDSQLFHALLDGHDVEYITGTFGITNDGLMSFVDSSLNSIYNIYNEIHIDEIPQTHILAPNRYDADIARYISEQEAKDNLADAKQAQIQQWLDGAMLCARLEHSYLPKKENFCEIDYEELLSIGIIAIQVLIKNKTQEQLVEYPMMYIITAVNWAIRNEMRIRYPWYSLVRDDWELISDGDFNLVRKYQESGLNSAQTLVRAVICRTIVSLNHFAEKTGNGKRFLDELNRIYNGILSARDSMPEKYLECFDMFFDNDCDFYMIDNQFPPTIIDGMFTQLGNVMKDKGIKIYK